MSLNSCESSGRKAGFEVQGSRRKKHITTSMFLIASIGDHFDLAVLCAHTNEVSGKRQSCCSLVCHTPLSMTLTVFVSQLLGITVLTLDARKMFAAQSYLVVLIERS